MKEFTGHVMSLRIYIAGVFVLAVILSAALFASASGATYSSSTRIAVATHWEDDIQQLPEAMA